MASQSKSVDPLQVEKSENGDDAAIVVEPLSLYTTAEDDTAAYIADVKLAGTAFDAVLKSALDWAPADETAMSARDRGCLNIMHLRSTIILPSGFPDWAGNSALYSGTIAKRFANAATLAGLSVERMNAFRNVCAEYMSRTRYVDLYVAKYVATHTPNLATTKVGKGEDAPTVIEVLKSATKGTTIPAPVRTEMAKHYKAQISSGGNRLAGFKATPTKVGEKAKSVPSGGRGAGNTGHTTPSKLWERLADEVSKLAPHVTVVECRKLSTAIGDAWIGPEGKAGKFKSIGQKGDVILHARAMADYWTKLADHLDDVPGATKGVVNKVRYEV